MVNNSTNTRINKMNDHISFLLIDHNKDHEILQWKSSPKMWRCKAGLWDPPLDN